MQECNNCREGSCVVCVNGGVHVCEKWGCMCVTGVGEGGVCKEVRVVGLLDMVNNDRWSHTSSQTCLPSQHLTTNHIHPPHFSYNHTPPTVLLLTIFPPRPYLQQHRILRLLHLLHQYLSLPVVIRHDVTHTQVGKYNGGYGDQVIDCCSCRGFIKSNCLCPPCFLLGGWVGRGECVGNVE